MRTLALALCVAALAASGADAGFAKQDGSVDRASTHTAAAAWLRYARAGTAAIRTGRGRIDQYSSSVTSSCANVLQAVNGTPGDAYDWAVLNKLFEEVQTDVVFALFRPALAQFDRFASQVAPLQWSARADRAAIGRSLKLQRRALAQKPSDVCAAARAIAAKPDAIPTGTATFITLARRNARSSGLVGLDLILRHHARRSDQKLIDKVDDLRFDALFKAANLAAAGGDKLLVALGLGRPVEIRRQDADAQSDARNMVSQVEACYTDKQDYTKCRAPENTGLALGSGRGQVEVTEATQSSYTVVAHSVSGTDFSVKMTGGRVTRPCSRPAIAACGPGGTWEVDA